MPLTAPAADKLLSQAGPRGDSFVLTLAGPQTVMAAGGHLPVGTVLQFIRSTRITNLDEVRSWRQAGTDGTINVQLEPGETREMTLQAASPGTLAFG